MSYVDLGDIEASWTDITARHQPHCWSSSCVLAGWGALDVCSKNQVDPPRRENGPPSPCARVLAP